MIKIIFYTQVFRGFNTVDIVFCYDGSIYSPIPVSCPSLLPPANGNTSLTSTGTVTMVTYTCDVGYTLVGSQTRNCKTSGAWTGAQPTCGKYCGDNS